MTLKVTGSQICVCMRVRVCVCPQHTIIQFYAAEGCSERERSHMAGHSGICSVQLFPSGKLALTLLLRRVCVSVGISPCTLAIIDGGKLTVCVFCV